MIALPEDYKEFVVLLNINKEKSGRDKDKDDLKNLPSESTKKAYPILRFPSQKEPDLFALIVCVLLSNFQSDLLAETSYLNRFSK